VPLAEPDDWDHELMSVRDATFDLVR
jgi:hypothetical protein